MLAETKQNLVELQKKVDKGISEGLNNKASFKSIIDVIDRKKRRDKTVLNYVNQTVKRRNNPSDCPSTTDYLCPSQPRNVFSDDWDGGLNSGFFETFSHKSLLPRMISKIYNVGKADPVTEPLKLKWEWANKWKAFKIAYWKLKRNAYKWFKDDVLYCPRAFAEMAEHLVNKPEPLLEDAYNWYYAGNGNMLIIKINGSEFIVHSEFNCLYVSPFYRDSLSIDYENTVTYQCPEDLNILETVHSQNIIALRTKFKVIILKIVIFEEGMGLDRLKEMDWELPFTSISFDEFHKNILYVSTLDCQLTIVNLDRMSRLSKKLRGKVPSLVDNWNSVIGSERGYYTHVTKHALTLYDKRTNEPYQRWKTFGLVSDVEVCGRVSAVKYCSGKPLLYVGTDHYLFLMDMRCGKTKQDNVKPIQRWTHGMMNPPTYMDICAYDREANKEVVCLSSQYVEDMCLVSNHSDAFTRTGEISGLALPYRPPSIMQTYNEAQRKRLCCNLYEPIQPRLCSSITGTTVVDQGDNFVVLQQNCLGDVSCHSLYPAAMFAFIEDDNTERLHEWSKDYKEQCKPLDASHVIDIRVFLKRLFRVPGDYILGRNTAMEPRIKFNEKDIYDTYEKEELDPEFLEIWKNREEEITLDKTNMPDDMSQFFVEE